MTYSPWPGRTAGPFAQHSAGWRRQPLGTAGFGQQDMIRILDITLALLLLLFMAPLMLILCLLIAITDPGPVFFAHRRVGRNGRAFHCLKFRSMAVDAEQRLRDLLASDPSAREAWRRDHKLPNDPRITPLGRFLRRSSLDELPQLVNVLMGDMSLVGPRPITMDERRHYGRYFEHYCRVPPGLTGIWQVSGRSNTSYRRRVAMDVCYVRNNSPLLYLSILTRTVPAVLLARGSA
jgi:exopolysaccharide production protein ExoY